jgi:PleD family two-component response regulator
MPGSSGLIARRGRQGGPPNVIEDIAAVSTARILISEDEHHLREILRFQLESAGFEVVETQDGQDAVERAIREKPDLILLDIMMPRLSGYEACRRLRAELVTRNTPIIMLTAKSESDDKLEGLKGGANDYVTKPWDRRELVQRIQNVLEWSRQQRSASPLTGLPGNVSITEELRRRIEREIPFAMLQVDIDYFKAFNDHYGYTRGDSAIQTVAMILTECTQRLGGDETFVGHIGGDDFVVLCKPEVATQLGEEIIAEFDRLTPDLYDAEDRTNGYVEVRNRRHQLERFPLMSLTIALVDSLRMPITHLAQLADIAQELKAHGKGITGSVLVGERRATDDPDARADRDVA